MVYIYLKVEMSFVRKFDYSTFSYLADNVSALDRRALNHVLRELLGEILVDRDYSVSVIDTYAVTHEVIVIHLRYNAVEACFYVTSELCRYVNSRVGSVISERERINELADAAAMAVGKVMNFLALLEQVTSFESPEILALGEKKVFEFIDANPDLEYYRFIMEKLFRSSMHVLSEDKEKLISYFSPITSEGSELYTSLTTADGKAKTIRLSNGERVTVTQGSWTSLIADAPSASDRKNIFEAIFSS